MKNKFNIGDKVLFDLWLGEDEELEEIIWEITSISSKDGEVIYSVGECFSICENKIYTLTHEDLMRLMDDEIAKIKVVFSQLMDYLRKEGHETDDQEIND